MDAVTKFQITFDMITFMISKEKRACRSSIRSHSLNINLPGNHTHAADRGKRGGKVDGVGGNRVGDVREVG
jgi:hypothetical protein